MSFLDALPDAIDGDTARRFAAFLAGDPGASRDAYYADQRVRFERRDDDVLLVAPDAVVTPGGCGARIASERARAARDACGVDPETARRVIASIDGTRTAAAARAHSGVEPAAWDRVVSETFGSIVFSPLAIAALDARVSAAEIVRFVGSPYEIVRAYWENMASVAERIESSLASRVASPVRFAEFLRKLHALALVGETGTSFYRPASPSAAKRAEQPGAFLLEASVVDGDRFVSGPRVGAGAIGSAHHQALLVESLGAAATAPDAAAWGRVVVARADGDAAAAAWFCPPRPLGPEPFAALGAELAHALENPAASIPALARFHWGFARLHPFAFANQCVAMSLVNHVLRRGHGAGIPHHVLDHLALGLPRAAYEQVFERAVAAFLVSGETAVARTLALAERKRRLFALLHRLGAAPSLDAARQIAREDPEGARLALLA